MLNGEKQLNENRIQIHKKVYQDGTCLIRCRNYRGDTRMEIHGVFPGIQLIYIAAHTDRCPFGATGREKRIEIHHCREGRIERRHADRYLYLAPGDMALLQPQSDSGDLSFPLCHYHGIAITIDTAVAPKCFSCFLEDVDVQPKQLADRLCGQSGCFVARRKKYVEHVFSELYTVPKSYRKGYFKVKIKENAAGTETGNEFGTVTVAADGKTITATYEVDSFSPFIVYAFIEADEPEIKTLSATIVDGSDDTAEAPDTSDPVESPQTGDGWIWSVVAILAAGAAITIVIYTKKKKK